MRLPRPPPPPTSHGSRQLRVTSSPMALLFGSCVLLLLLLLSLPGGGAMAAPDDKGAAKTWNVLDWLSRQAVLSTDFSCNNCNNFTYDYLIPNACDDDLYLLFVVAVGHNMTEARRAIRNTWARVTSYRERRIRTIFVLGEHDNQTLNEQVFAEHERHGDILMGRFPDRYRTLTEKVMFALRWITERCPARYVVKTDDDVFHVPQRYVDYLLDHDLPDRFVGGRCVITRPPRTETVKTYVSREIYPYIYSPYYCQGGGYIVSQPAVRDIVDVAPRMRYTPLEDQFVSGMCRYTMLIPYYQIDGVLAKKGAQTQPCTLKRIVKSTHKVYPAEMYQLWDELNKRNPRCIFSINLNLVIVVVTFLLLWAKFLQSMY